MFLSLLHQVHNYIHQHNNNQHGDNKFHFTLPFRFYLTNTLNLVDKLMYTPLSTNKNQASLCDSPYNPSLIAIISKASFRCPYRNTRETHLGLSMDA